MDQKFWSLKQRNMVQNNYLLKNSTKQSEFIQIIISFLVISEYGEKA